MTGGQSSERGAPGGRTGGPGTLLMVRLATRSRLARRLRPYSEARPLSSQGDPSDGKSEARSVISRQPPATRLLPALGALLAVADAIPVPGLLPDDPSGGRDPAAGLRRQPHPQGVCEAVGGLRLLGRLATHGHNDGAIRAELPSLVPKVTIASSDKATFPTNAIAKLCLTVAS